MLQTSSKENKFPTPADWAIETRNLSYRFGRGDLTLDNINLRVPRHSIYGFLGPNGAGKSTTLRLLLGLLRNQRGSISIFGKCLQSSRLEILKDVGSLIETPSLYDHLTARENLRVWQKVHRYPDRRLDEVLAAVGLHDTGKKRIQQFSLGMKQRLGIAVALLHQPSLLILDEPTNGLDPNGIIEIRELLTRLYRAEGLTIVVSSHLLAEIEKLVSDLGIIHRGQLIFQGTMNELRTRQRGGHSVSFATTNAEAALRVMAGEQIATRLVEGKIELPAMTNHKIARMNQLLVQNGVGVHGISAGKDDLETIFMDLIGDQKP